MKKMNYAEPFIDGYNAVVGTIVAVVLYFRGTLGTFCCVSSA